MNKITIERALLEQALEWVEAQPEPRMLGAAKIITSLREALTQQSSRHVKESLSTVLEQPQPVQQPVATVQCIHGVTIGYLEVMQPVGTKLYTSPQEQPLTVAGGAVFQDAEGKRPVTAIGQPVGRWEPTPLFPPGGAGVFLERPQAQPQPVQEQCPECDGTGTVAGSQAHFPCPLCTSPQAAQPLSDVGKDAARYRWLRSTTNYVTSNGNKIDVRNQPELWDSTIDAAIEAAHSITKGTT